MKQSQTDAKQDDDQITKLWTDMFIIKDPWLKMDGLKMIKDPMCEKTFLPK